MKSQLSAEESIVSFIKKKLVAQQKILVSMTLIYKLVLLWLMGSLEAWSGLRPAVTWSHVLDALIVHRAFIIVKWSRKQNFKLLSVCGWYSKRRSCSLHDMQSTDQAVCRPYSLQAIQPVDHTSCRTYNLKTIQHIDHLFCSLYSL